MNGTSGKSWYAYAAGAWPVVSSTAFGLVMVGVVWATLESKNGEQDRRLSNVEADITLLRQDIPAQIDRNNQSVTIQLNRMQAQLTEIQRALLTGNNHSNGGN